MHLFRWTAVCLCLTLLLSACGLFSSDPVSNRQQQQEAREKKQDAMTAAEVLDETVSVMEKMKGFRWDSVNRQQYAFVKRPAKSTRIERKQQMEVIRRPLRIHTDGTLTFHRELESETIPQRGYSMEDQEFRFERNRWYERKRTGAEEGMKPDADPLWLLKQSQSVGGKYEVDRGGKQLLLTLRLSGKEAAPYIDKTSIHLVSIGGSPPRYLNPTTQIRLAIDPETFRLIGIEEAVEFTLRTEKETVKARQEWSHRLKGEVNKIQVPETIRRSAVPVPEFQDEKGKGDRLGNSA